MKFVPEVRVARESMDFVSLCVYVFVYGLCLCVCAHLRAGLFRRKGGREKYK